MEESTLLTVTIISNSAQGSISMLESAFSSTPFFKITSSKVYKIVTISVSVIIWCRWRFSICVIYCPIVGHICCRWCCCVCCGWMCILHDILIDVSWSAVISISELDWRMRRKSCFIVANNRRTSTVWRFSYLYCWHIWNRCDVLIWWRNRYHIIWIRLVFRLIFF